MSSLGGLFRHAKTIESFAAGQKIFAAGDLGDTMYAIQDGEVDIVIDGKVVETATAGAIFGEMALIDDAPRSADAIARTECHLVPVDKQHFLFMVTETPNFALQVMHIMANRLRANHT